MLVLVGIFLFNVYDSLVSLSFMIVSSNTQTVSAVQARNLDFLANLVFVYKVNFKPFFEVNLYLLNRNLMSASLKKA